MQIHNHVGNRHLKVRPADLGKHDVVQGDCQNAISKFTVFNKIHVFFAAKIIICDLMTVSKELKSVTNKITFIGKS